MTPHINKKLRIVIWFCLLMALAGLMLLIFTMQPAQPHQDFSLSDDKKLVIYTSHKKEVYEPIIREFEERTGIWTTVVSGGTTEMLNRLREEQHSDDSSQTTLTCDVMFGGGVDSLEAYKDCFSPYQAANSGNIDTLYYSDDNSWTPFSKLPLVFIYNTKLVTELDAPKTWDELMEKQWQGKIAFADPRKSGTSYTALATMIQRRKNEDATPEKDTIEQFARALDGKTSESSGAVITDVDSGSCLVGITLEEIARKTIAQNSGLGMIYPQDGTTSVPDGTAISTTAKHRANAELFIDFTLSEDVQNFLRDVCYRRPVRTDMPTGEAFEELPYDFKWASSNQSELLDEWAEVLEN